MIYWAIGPHTLLQEKGKVAYWQSQSSIPVVIFAISRHWEVHKWQIGLNQRYWITLAFINRFRILATSNQNESNTLPITVLIIIRAIWKVNILLTFYLQIIQVTHHKVSGKSEGRQRKDLVWREDESDITARQAISGWPNEANTICDWLQLTVWAYSEQVFWSWMCERS